MVRTRAGVHLFGAHSAVPTRKRTAAAHGTNAAKDIFKPK